MKNIIRKILTITVVVLSFLLSFSDISAILGLAGLGFGGSCVPQSETVEVLGYEFIAQEDERWYETFLFYNNLSPKEKEYLWMGIAALIIISFYILIKLLPRFYRYLVMIFKKYKHKK